MIKDNLQNLIFEAMKSKDEVRLSTLKMLSSALNYERIAKMHELTEEEELVVVAREAKKRKEAIDAYGAAKGKSTNSSISMEDRIAREQKELNSLEEFLPEQLSDEDLDKIVTEAISQMNVSTIAEMGKVIGAVKSKVGATADGARIAQIVKSKLTRLLND
ncbi:GatB/YqeY domain-containing protein [Candidatus Woesebacteria bacterium]|nr:GatB/YqeY domain-containing protein [Candidatus Woesebacteria bacterium]